MSSDLSPKYKPAPTPKRKPLSKRLRLRLRLSLTPTVEQVELAVMAQMLHFVKSDLRVMHPDESGQRVCAMALAHFSHFTVSLADKMDAVEGAQAFPSGVLDRVRGPYPYS